MADINAAFVIEDGIAFDSTQTGIFTGTVDPRVGEAAPVGSLFIRTDGTLYIKTGSPDIEWQSLLRQNDVSFDALAPTTSKGDLVVRGTSGNARLAVGPDNFVLVADATQPLGLRWASAPAAVSAHSALTGLTNDDHTQYVHTSVARTISALHTFSPSTPSAPFALATNAQGQLVTGLNADLLDGQHAASFQPVSANLTSLAAIAAAGIPSRSAGGVWTMRSIVGTAGQIVVANGDGVSGSPTIALSTVGTAGTYGSATAVPAITTDAYGRVTNVTLTGITFPVTSVFGRTGAIVAQEGDYSLTQMSDVTVTTPTTGQVLQFNGTQWVNGTAAGGGSGAVTSVAAAAPSAGLTITGSPITSSGTLTFALANDLAAVEGLSTSGLAVRAGPDTWTTRSIVGTANQIVVANGSATAGNPTVSLSANPIIPGTGAVQVPVGSTAERQTPASNGMVRFNSETNNYEAWVVDKWVNLAQFTAGGQYQLNAYLGPIPSTTGTSAVPYDSTEPLVTEGTEIWTKTITPASSASRFVVECPFTVDLGTSNRVLIVSIFRNSVNLGTALFYSTGGGRPVTLSMKVNDEPATTAPITFSMRAGVGAGSGTWYINANASGSTLGGKLVSQYEIREIAT